MIVEVCAGTTAAGETVTRYTRFMGYSTAKGVSAAIIAPAGPPPPTAAEGSVRSCRCGQRPREK